MPKPSRRTPVTKAVVTVPAYFNDAQDKPPGMPERSPASTSCAWSTNPAAALAYGLDKRKEGIIAVIQISAAALSTFQSQLHDGIFEVWRPTAILTSAETTSTTCSSIALEDLQSEWGEDLSIQAKQFRRCEKR